MYRRVVRYIFTTKIVRRDGTVLYAKDYGLKAFRIPVYDDGSLETDFLR